MERSYTSPGVRIPRLILMQAPSPITVALENAAGVSFKQFGSARPSVAKDEAGINISMSKDATITEERIQRCKPWPTSMMWPFAQDNQPSPVQTKWLIEPDSEI